MTPEEKRKKACENSRKYYQTHKEEILQKQAVYRKKKYAEDEEYRKKVYENSRRWIKKNPEKAYAIKRKWQVEHREPTKDEIIERLQKKIMWLEDTLADREDYIFHLECLVEKREQEIQEKEEQIKQLEENNQNIQEEIIQEYHRYKRCLNYLECEIENIERIITMDKKTKNNFWLIAKLHTWINAIDSLVEEQISEGEDE